MMSNRPLRFGRRGSSQVRKRAAELAIGESLTGAPPHSGPTGPGELAEELASMRSLVRTLDQLPGQAWAEVPPLPATAPRTAGSTARPRLGLTLVRLRIAPGFGGPLAAATLAVAFFVGALTHPFSAATTRPLGPGLAAPARHVVLKPLPGTAAHSLAVAYMPGGGHMVLNVRNLPRSAPGTYYELWLMTSDTDLVSVTSFRVGARGTSSLKLVLPDDPSHYRYLDISVQHLAAGVSISQDNVLRGALPA